MHATSTHAPRPGTFAAFGSRDFRLLWGGQTISFVGDAAFLVALGWRVTELTGKAGSLGYVLALQSVGTLATLLLGGVLADRYPRRRLMIASDLVRAAVVVGLLAAELTGNLTLPAVLVLAASFGLAAGFFQPAFSGIVPLVVERPMLPSANSWLGIGRNASAVVGPAIAAGLYASGGPSFVWAIEAASFLVSAGAVWLARPRSGDPGPRATIGRELTEGFRYVASVPWLATGIAAATLVMMVAMAPYTALLPQVVRSHYGRGVGSYGVLFSLTAGGMAAGAFVWARWHRQRRRMVFCFVTLAINDIGIVGVALSPWYWLAMPAAIWRGFFIGVGSSAWTTLLTGLVPERLLSRVSSLNYFGELGLTPVGFVIAAAVATAVSPTTILVTGGTLGFVLWLAPLAWSRVRAVD